jgi:dihydroceramidase
MEDYFINDSSSSSSSSNNSNNNVELHTRHRHHTASIDFCESNYLLSNVIVEPHNVWSSIVAFTFLGAVGIVYGNPLHEWRIFALYFILLLIGIGSSALHATLYSSYQSIDELPMLYLIICSFYAVLEIDTPKNEKKQKYPNLHIHLLLLSCVCTAVYYFFQQLYVIFLLTFILLTVIIFSLHIRIAMRLHHEVQNKKKNNNNSRTTITTKEIALQFYKLHHVAYTIIASPIWVIDQFGCNYLLSTYNRLPFPFTGMTLHVLWHFCAGLGTHYFIQFLCACRMDALGIVGDVRYVVFGLLPVVIVVDDNIKTK